jgi:hypothetical protein
VVAVVIVVKAGYFRPAATYRSASPQKDYSNPLPIHFSLFWPSALTEIYTKPVLSIDL